MEAMRASGLTHEEECMLKTALAFVVIKSRYKNSARQQSEEDSESGAAACSQHDEENEADQGNSGESKGTGSWTSTLDGLFGSSPSSPPKKWKECGGKQSFDVDANIVQPTPQGPNKKSFLQSAINERHLSSIFRAACSLARADLDTRFRTNDGSRPDKMALFGAAGHLANQMQVLLLRKTNVFVPISPQNNETDEEEEAKDEKEERHEPKKNKVVISPEAFLQEWIRGSLLEALTSHGDIVDADSVQDDIQKLLAAFHVFQVMVPQLVNISPPLVGNIFQATTKILRDLYDDEIAVAPRQDASVKRLFDHLATSTLRLMETCWVSEPTKIGEKNNRARHREFMRNELQYRLADFLDPVPLQQIPHVYQDLCNQQKPRQHHRSMISDGIATSPTDTHEKRTENTLGPGAKLIIRMAVYRIFMQG